MPEQCHIASLLVHVRPDASQGLMDYLAAHRDIEVHAASPEGKLVLVVERSRPDGITDALEQLAGQPGVVNCVLIYHESMTAMEGDQVLTGSAGAPAA
ncbi:MAG: chaperone NapD [Marinobacter sp.]|uniref:chaperone NapD n=1 Tax=Marinobacter sp. TaxID=50741 RepID=UPI00299E4F9C|nr:chaperone NapD [Marinobacter sp.]MDX1633974.1 chaperone NapD [Marinobacter sp.]